MKEHKVRPKNLSGTKIETAPPSSVLDVGGATGRRRRGLRLYAIMLSPFFLSFTSVLSFNRSVSILTIAFVITAGSPRRQPVAVSRNAWLLPYGSGFTGPNYLWGVPQSIDPVRCRSESLKSQSSCSCSITSSAELTRDCGGRVSLGEVSPRGSCNLLPLTNHNTPESSAASSTLSRLFSSDSECCSVRRRPSLSNHEMGFTKFYLDLANPTWLTGPHLLLLVSQPITKWGVASFFSEKRTILPSASSLRNVFPPNTKWSCVSLSITVLSSCGAVRLGPEDATDVVSTILRGADWILTSQCKVTKSQVSGVAVILALMHSSLASSSLSIYLRGLSTFILYALVFIILRVCLNSSLICSSNV
ncbi:Uncharacterized protein Rs2_39118 [Raphanus sativus]|nr:Uncharacterized protein Rs2_39118 [Raphanus sativus]